MYIKDDILYFDYGYVNIGDIDKVRSVVDKLITELPKPFQSISLYNRAVELSSLPASEESEKISTFSDYLDESGRDLSVRGIHENSVLYHSLEELVHKSSVKDAHTREEALQIVEDHRKKSPIK